MFAYETTIEDLDIALIQLGMELDDEAMENMFDSLDAGAIKKAALRATDSSDQFHFVLEEIKHQIQKEA